MESTDIWDILNGGESWEEFEKTENWWDDEEEIDWNIDVLSGKRIKPEVPYMRLKPKASGMKNKNVINGIKISDVKSNFSNNLRPTKSDLIQKAKNPDKARKISIIDMNESSEDSSKN